MKILFVVPYAPNAIRVRPYNLIKALAAAGHSLTVATLWTAESERRDLDDLRASGVLVLAAPLPRWRSLANCARALPTRTPLQAVYCWQPALARQIEVALHDGGYDLAHVEHLRGARYGLRLRAWRDGDGRRLPIVWDSVDCISHLFAQAAERSGSAFGRWASRLELGRTRRYEGWLAGQFDRVLVTSAVDQQALAALAHPDSGSPITILPNGVDLDYFAPAGEPREPTTLVISGKMSYHANVTAALYLVHDVMPHVWRERPEVRVWIVGKDPPREVRQLAGPGSRVVVTGTVPDLRPYLQRATLAVAPMPYGAGIQNKVLEAMACATPVVASAQAGLALQAQDGRDLVLAGGAEAFARAVLDLLAGAQRREELGRAGRHYVEEHHDWAAVAGRLLSIYGDLIAQA